MKWWILLAAVVDCSFVSEMHADDYRLRIEAVECNSEKDCMVSIVDSIEVVTRPGEKFRTKVVLGAQTRVLVGKLVQKENGGFAVQILYVRSFETGDFISIAEGERLPVTNISSVSTTVDTTVGSPLAIGEFASSFEKRENDSKAMKLRILMTLSIADANDEDTEIK
jgi:hypothetical protein